MKSFKSVLVIINILCLCQTGFCNDNMPVNTVIDSLKHRLEFSESHERFDLLLQLSTHIGHTDVDQAEHYLLEAKTHIDESLINQQLFDYYKQMARIKLYQNHFNESLELSEKALQLQFSDLDYKDHIGVHENKGMAYTFLGKNVESLESLFKGLRIADSLQLDTLKASTYHAIGSVYTVMNDSIMTEKYLLLAIDQARKVNDQRIAALGIGNLAILYINQKKYDTAEKLSFEGIQLAQKVGGGSAIGLFYNNLGVIYKEQNMFEKSLEYVQKGLEIAEQYQLRSSIALGYINKANAYMELQQHELAKENIETGLKIALELNSKPYFATGLLSASQIYERAGKHSKALSYYKEYTKLNDSLLNESRIKAVAELEQKYESEKKEKEILALSNDKTSAERRERNLVQAIILLCCGLLAIGSLFYFVRQNLYKNSIIQTKNLKIASDKIQLLEKGKDIIALESLVKGQENERERLAKEMHDGLGGLLAISHSKLANLSVPEIKVNAALSEARDLVGDAYKQVRQISHNLMPLDLEKFGLIAALSNMIKTINQQNDINIDFRTYHFDLFLNNELGLNIYRISQEAIANVLKSAKARHVLIELFQHEDMISLSIEDDGIGFNVHEKDSGIGIRSMRNRTELLNGKFSIESKLSVGTSIFVLFPIHSKEPDLYETSKSGSV